MAKTTGLGDRLFVGGYDLSGDIGAVNTVASSHGLLVVTGIDKSATERVGGDRDGEISFNSWWDTAAGASHPILSSLPATDRQVQYLNGQAAGNPAACLLGKQIDYAPSLAADGALAATTQCLANAQGLEWGVQLTTGKQTLNAAGNGSDVDDLAGSPTSTAFGAAAYLQVFGFTGTSAAISVHDAATLPTYTLVSGLSFASVTGITTERIVTTLATTTVRRYVRVVVTGTFSSLIFSVVLVRYRVAVS